MTTSNDKIQTTSLHEIARRERVRREMLVQLAVRSATRGQFLTRVARFADVIAWAPRGR